jgi:hypothetical protein
MFRPIFSKTVIMLVVIVALILPATMLVHAQNCCILGPFITTCQASDNATGGYINVTLTHRWRQMYSYTWQGKVQSVGIVAEDYDASGWYWLDHRNEIQPNPLPTPWTQSEINGHASADFHKYAHQISTARVNFTVTPTGGCITSTSQGY